MIISLTTPATSAASIRLFAYFLFGHAAAAAAAAAAIATSSAAAAAVVWEAIRPLPGLWLLEQGP